MNYFSTKWQETRISPSLNFLLDYQMENYKQPSSSIMVTDGIHFLKTAPTAGKLKINTYAAIKKEGVGFGVIVRNDQGMVMLAVNFESSMHVMSKVKPI